jgi:hypothetical protein
MMRAIALIVLGCAPHLAMADGHKDICKATIDFVTELLPGLSVDAGTSAARDVDGWCTVAQASTGDVTLREIAFRLDDTDEGLDLDIKVDALEVDDHEFDVVASFAFLSETNVLTIQRMSARSDERYGFAVSGQVIMGDANTVRGRLTDMAVRSLTVQAFVTPEILNDIGLLGDDLPCVVVTDAVSALGCGEIDRQSRRELTRFAGAMPNATGRFDVTIDAPDGAAVSEIVTPFIGISDEDIPRAIGSVLSDKLQIALQWNPGRM